MTLQLEEAIGGLDRADAIRVLEAVNGTLVALRRDAEEIGRTREIEELVERIDTYLGHLDRQRGELTGSGPSRA